MDVLADIAAYLGGALAAAGAGLASALGPPVAAMALASATSSFAERNLVSLLGPRAFLAILGWLGTAVHELAHAATCLLFRHRITDLRLFDPSMRTGSVGYVEHEWNRDSLYQKIGNFFIGLAPLLLGSAILAGAAGLLLNGSMQVPGTWKQSETLMYLVLERLRGIAAGLWTAERAADWRTWLLVYLAAAVGTSMGTSREDLKGVFHGVGFLLAAVLGFYLATHWAVDWNARLAAPVATVQVPLLSVLLLVSGLNLTIGLLSLGLCRLVRGYQR